MRTKDRSVLVLRFRRDRCSDLIIFTHCFRGRIVLMRKRVRHQKEDRRARHRLLRCSSLRILNLEIARVMPLSNINCTAGQHASCD